MSSSTRLVALCLIFISLTQANADIVYNLNNPNGDIAYSNNNDRFSGSITTDGTLGVLGVENIVAWNVAVVGDLTLSFASTDVDVGSDGEYTYALNN